MNAVPLTLIKLDDIPGYRLDHQVWDLMEIFETCGRERTFRFLN